MYGLIGQPCVGEALRIWVTAFRSCADSLAIGKYSLTFHAYCLKYTPDVHFLFTLAPDNVRTLFGSCWIMPCDVCHPGEDIP